MRVLITGGTGLIGSAICKELIKKYQNIEITILTRNRLLANQEKISYVNNFDESKGSFNTIINLAGEPINKGRWTNNKKLSLLSSRINITNQLVEYIKTQKQKPEIFISGSAIGFYGSDKNQIFYEETPPAEANFTNKLCDQWEKAANLVKDFGVRIVNLRTGIVLAKNGGILKEMIFPFKFGLGCKIGDGSAWMSWIHLKDLCSLIIFIIEHKSIEGPVNATSPNPVQNKEFSAILAKKLNRPLLFTMPAFFVKILFGEMGETLLLQGQKVEPKKITNSGFIFNFAELDSALKDIIT